jgi:hypothetical protein
MIFFKLTFSNDFFKLTFKNSYGTESLLKVH